MDIQLLCGDALEVLKTLPSESVHCIVTSPPYWGLRNYGVDGQLGAEITPEEYVGKLVVIFREARRVLRKDGTLWLNIGDTSAAKRKYQVNDSKWGDVGNHKGMMIPKDCKAKDLIGIPWMVAFALRADGWYLRSEIIWGKPNVMPESVKDRPSRSHEKIFLFAKSPKYYYDRTAILEPLKCPKAADGSRIFGGKNKHGASLNHARTTGRAYASTPAGRNKRDIWLVNTRPFKGAHFATFNPELITPCVLSGTSEKGVCPKCGAPWKRVIEKTGEWRSQHDRKQKHDGTIYRANPGGGLSGPNTTREDHFIGWCPSCQCGCEPVPAVVLDPFNGAATTGLVAQKYGRNYIGIDLNPDYIEMSRKRLGVSL
jgi:DNA modification methylase